MRASAPLLAARLFAAPLLAVLLSVTLVSCKHGAATSAISPAERGADASGPAASTAEAPSPPTASASTEPDKAVYSAPPAPAAINWIQDDAKTALVEARESATLLFVDVWAEWCHTCLSMKSSVFTEPSLAEFTRDFTFVQLDSDNPTNAEFLERFEINVWPTFLVLDPKSASADAPGMVGYWPGAGSLSEMKQFLAHSREIGDSLLENRTPDPLLSHFISARSAQGEGKTELALKHFEAAYAEMPVDWARRSELLLGYVRSLIQRGRFEDCAKLGERHLDEVRGAAIPIQFAKRTFTCLTQTQLPNRKQRIERTLERMRQIAYSQDPQMSFDDRADALDILASCLGKTGSEQAAEAVNRDRLQLVEAAAAAATTPELARTFDQARAMAYVSMGREQDAVNLLTQREKEFPGSASPAAQLAQVYEALGRLPEARVALTRACALAQGQRKATLLGRSAQLARREGDTQAERSALSEQIRELGKLRSAVAQKQQRAARARLKQLEATPTQ